MNKQQIEELTCRKEFVNAAVIHAVAIGEIGERGERGEIGGGFRILEAGGRDDLFELLKKEFPGAEVERQKEAELLEKGTFDYIAAAGLRYLPCGEETDRVFRQWIACLKPGGVMSAHVCGYSGYYGAVMLGAVIRRLSRGKNPADTVKIARTVIRELPETHPAFASDILNPRDEMAVKELLDLSAAIDHVDKLFTVSKLLEAVPRWGGRFLQWVLPALYEPAPWFESLEPAILRRLNALPAPRRAIASELLSASPSRHYFLVQKI